MIARLATLLLENLCDTYQFWGMDGDKSAENIKIMGTGIAERGYRHVYAGIRIPNTKASGYAANEQRPPLYCFNYNMVP